MRKKDTPEINLEHAIPGQLFRLRDGNKIVFVQRLHNASPSLACFQFCTLTPPSITCFRTGKGKLSSVQNGQDSRDIVAEIKPDLSEHDLGQHYRLRNGATGWMQQILPESDAKFRWMVGGRYYQRDGSCIISGDPSPFDIVFAVTPRGAAEEKAPDAPKATINLAELPLGTEFRRQDGEIVMLTDRFGTQKQWPFRVGDQNYMFDGRYMSANQPNAKDLVEVILRKKKTPLTRAQALFAFRKLARRMKKSDCDKFLGLMQFLEDTPK